VESSATAVTEDFGDLERHRRELTAHCYRMLGSPFEAEDAVQDTLLRAWRALDSFEGRASLRSWLYRIATNVCLDMLESKQRRARPMDLGEARSPNGPIGEILPETTWIEPVPDVLVVGDADPASVAESHESIRLAFVAALACRADPLRGPAVEGRGGRRTARHERRRRQQLAAAGARDAGARRDLRRRALADL
jgi:RNA polymerase sigma-70 factor (ECF subfamily)